MLQKLFCLIFGHTWALMGWREEPHPTRPDLKRVIYLHECVECSTTRELAQQWAAKTMDVEVMP